MTRVANMNIKMAVLILANSSELHIRKVKIKHGSCTAKSI